MLATLTLFTLSALTPLQSAGDERLSGDWPHLRGPSWNGQAPALEVDRRQGELFMRAAWRAPLGPAYSGVAVSEGRAVTLFSDGERDHVVALDVATGGELWRTEIGPTYLGHDGSEDGPIASPTLGGGLAFVVGPRGKLVALDLADGRERWSTHLVDDLGALSPEYGFGTTPLFVEGLLVVQAGGSEGRGVCGFEAATGALRWKVGDGRAGYQSPVLLDVGGAPQVVVLSFREILGIAPATGELLWRHELGGRDNASSGMALSIGEQRFAAFVSGSLAAFRIVPEDGGFELQELYRSRELGGSYACPVYHAGHLYGFRGDFLTCVDAATGERVWKSRPPGGAGVVALGEHLLVFAANGVAALVAASPAGYSEQGRLQALEYSSLTWPSVAGERVFVRNSQELACLSLVRGRADALVSASAPERAKPTGEVQGAFARFLASVEAAEDKQAVVDAFLAGRESFPIVEDNVVHLLFQGDVEDVAVAGHMIESGKPEAMQRVPGTQLYTKSYEIEPGARFEYRYQVNFEEWLPDPLNPRRAPGSWGGDVSEVLTPTYAEADHIRAPRAAPRGRLEAFEYESAALGNARTLQVYLPAGYDEGDDDYPLLIVHRGDEWLEKGEMQNSLDNLIGREVRPLVAVFVPALEQWWFEGGGSGTLEYVDALASELVPALGERYRLTSDARERALLGTKHFGMTAVLGALRHSDVFGKAAVQSITLGDVSRHAVFELLEGEHRDVEFYVDWGRYEARNPDEGLDCKADSRRLWDALRARGYTVHGGEALDDHGWASWRSRLDELLGALFPLRAEPR